MTYTDFIMSILQKDISLEYDELRKIAINYVQESLAKEKKLILNGKDLSSEKLKERLQEEYSKKDKLFLLTPAAQNANSNKVTILGAYDKKKKELQTQKIEELKESIWNSLKKYRSKGICIVCEKETDILPLNIFISASSLKNPYNFEFGNIKKNMLGLCKKHINRILWFYLLDIWNKLTPHLSWIGYDAKIIVSFPTTSEGLVYANYKLNNREEIKNIDDFINILNSLKEDLSSIEKGNMLVIIYSIINNKVSMHKTYTIYNIGAFLENTKRLKEKLGVRGRLSPLLAVLKKSIHIDRDTIENAKLEILDLIFLGNSSLRNYKKAIFIIYRSLFFEERNRGNDISLINGIVKKLIMNNLEIIYESGRIVGLVDKWYRENKYNVRVGKIVFAKRNPTINDIKLALVDALRRIGLRDDLNSYILKNIKIDKVKELLQLLKEIKADSKDISLAFSAGYFSAYEHTSQITSQ